MKRMLLAMAVAVAAGSSALAGETASPERAAGVDVFSSSDADETTVSKVGISFDWRHAGEGDYQGVRLESVTFKPLGQDATEDLRAYYRFAGRRAGWAWTGQVGTDGRTAIGAFSLRTSTGLHPEVFVERDIVETSRGVKDGVYYTFAGGAFDLPMGDRDTLTFVGAIQDFTGRNRRLHARVNYIHVLQPDWGLSAQLRTRYFHSTEPGEFDYFSPRDFAQVLPTLQLRRRTAGWRYTVAAGLGAQRQTGAGWRPARSLSAQLTSPPIRDAWSVEAAFAYSNTPVGAGYTYDYRQFSLGLRRRF